MNKTLLIIIISLIIVGYFGLTISLDIIREEGKPFSSHWWWISGLIVVIVCTLIFVVIFLIRKIRSGKKVKEEPKEDKKNIGYYWNLVNQYTKKRLNEMYYLEDGFAVPFPSIENPKLMIVKGIGYNLNQTVFFAVGKNKVEYALPCDDINEFKGHLKPKLESITETTEEEPFTGKRRSIKFTKPMIEEEIRKRLEEEKEKEKEEERVETMESPKKEEK